MGDHTAKIQVTVWRDKSHSSIKTGDYASITNMAVAFYNNENNLSKFSLLLFLVCKCTKTGLFQFVRN